MPCQRHNAQPEAKHETAIIIITLIIGLYLLVGGCSGLFYTKNCQITAFTLLKIHK